MRIFDQSKSVLENLYLISGPILALLGFYIFKQIKLAKEQLTIAKEQLSEAQKQLNISSRRDSIKLAAEQIHFYLNTIIDYQNDLTDQLNNAKIDVLKIETKEFNLKDVHKNNPPDKVHEYHKIISPHLNAYVKVFNSMETFSTYFIQEVADENVAFEAVGATFCYSMNSYSYAFCILSKHEHRRFFQNTIKLYQLWAGRLESAGLRLKKESLEKEFSDRIKQMDEELQKKTDVAIKPLGTTTQ